MAETAKINLAVQVKWNCVGPSVCPRRSAAYPAARRRLRNRSDRPDERGRLL